MDEHGIANLDKHPLFGRPCPPLPDCWAEDPTWRDEELTAEKKVALVAALDWMLVNFAYREGALRGKGGIFRWPMARSPRR